METINDVVSVYYHPTEGMFGRIDQQMEAAQRQARVFANEHYSTMPMMDTWTLTGWWLMEDEGKPFFTPKPWPIAFALKKSSVREHMADIPRFIILLATSPSRFAFEKANTLEEARQKIVEMTKGLVEVVENPRHGLTGTWIDLSSTKRVVAHVIAL